MVCVEQGLEDVRYPFPLRRGSQVDRGEKERIGMRVEGRKFK